MRWPNRRAIILAIILAIIGEEVAAAMEIQLRTLGSVTILDISGNLTIGRSEENLRETVKRLIVEERRFLLLNLSEVPTIDSSGIGAMIKSFTSVSEANGKLKILKPSRM